jgi:hypothetical protein
VTTQSSGRCPGRLHFQLSPHTHIHTGEQLSVIVYVVHMRTMDRVPTKRAETKEEGEFSETDSVTIGRLKDYYGDKSIDASCNPIYQSPFLAVAELQLVLRAPQMRSLPLLLPATTFNGYIGEPTTRGMEWSEALK